MKTSRVLLLLAVLILAAAAAWYWAQRAPRGATQITVYYTKADGATEVAWPVSMRPSVPGESEAEHERNTVLYAATQAVAGPPSDTTAIRFPAGTHVLWAGVNGSLATVDLSREVTSRNDVSTELGEFKALVWTVTALPGIDSVQVRVQGAQLKTLPGGHLELDEPLRRSDF